MQKYVFDSEAFSKSYRDKFHEEAHPETIDAVKRMTKILIATFVYAKEGNELEDWLPVRKTEVSA